MESCSYAINEQNNVLKLVFDNTRNTLSFNEIVNYTFFSKGWHDAVLKILANDNFAKFNSVVDEIYKQLNHKKSKKLLSTFDVIFPTSSSYDIRIENIRKLVGLVNLLNKFEDTEISKLKKPLNEWEIFKGRTAENLLILRDFSCDREFCVNSLLAQRYSALENLSTPWLVPPSYLMLNLTEYTDDYVTESKSFRFWNQHAVEVIIPNFIINVKFSFEYFSLLNSPCVTEKPLIIKHIFDPLIEKWKSNLIDIKSVIHVADLSVTPMSTHHLKEYFETLFYNLIGKGSYKHAKQLLRYLPDDIYEECKSKYKAEESGENKIKIKTCVKKFLNKQMERRVSK